MNKYLIEITIPLSNGKEINDEIYYFTGISSSDSNPEPMPLCDNTVGFEGAIEKEKAFVFYDLKHAEKIYTKLTKGYIFKNIRIINI